MRPQPSMPRPAGPARHDRWPSLIPPLADHTAAYLAARMRRADEVAEAARARRLAQAGIGATTGALIIGRARGGVGASLLRLGERLRGTRPAGVAERAGPPTAPGLVAR